MKAATGGLGPLWVQEPGADREPVSAPPEELVAARKAFRLVGESFKGVLELHADYLQRQESLLLAKPIESTGRFHLRLEPGCMVLDIAEPSPLHIRSDERSHRIHYPKQQRAEELLFKENRLTKALIGCFRADLKLVESVFWIRSCRTSQTPREGQEPQHLATICLVPREEELRGAVRSLTVVFDLTGRLPVSVAQVNQEGEMVHFELSRVEMLRKPTPGAEEVFDRQLPEGTRVVRTKVPPVR